MADQNKSLLRVIVPIALLIGGVGLMWSVYRNTQNQKQPPATAPAATGATGPTVPTPAPTGQPAPPPAAPAPAAAPLGQLRTMVFDGDPASRDFSAIGSLDETSTDEMKVEFSTLGAGIKSIRLTRHYRTIQKTEHQLVQSEEIYSPPSGTEAATPAAPMGADSIEIDGQVVSLLGYFNDPVKGLTGSAVWRQVSPGSFEAFIVDASGVKVARVERTYRLSPGSFDLQLHQKIENLTGDARQIRWYQFGPIDLPPDPGTYGGDKRRLRFGYLLSPSNQTQTDPTVSFTDFVLPRASKNALGSTTETVKRVWPNDTSSKKSYRLSWAGLTNRYFAAAMHQIVPPGAGPDQKVLATVETVDRVLIHRWLPGNPPKDDPVMFLHMASGPVTVQAGKAADFSVGLYAGPLWSRVIDRDAAARDAGLAGLIVYNWGGPCAWCTFSWVTAVLLGLLRFLHDYVVFDWALGIIALVLIVRALLHRVTRYQQVRMARFSKQMQAMAPKQKKVQERFKDDPQKMREEMGKLWREEGVNPMSGAAGCLPAFLQTPIWIGLTATLFFAFDLRHRAGFFGIFQKVLPGHPKFLGWFLGDLAEPDRFVYFGKVLFTVPIFGIPIDGINILPIILGVVFFIQQKYLTPPPTAPLSPEQEQQQKIMKWMMVFMFPTLMYAAPSGLALYFIMNSTLGILESRYIRSHIDKYKLLEERKPAGGGFLARLQKVAEERQRMMQQRGGQPPRKKV